MWTSPFVKIVQQIMAISMVPIILSQVPANEGFKWNFDKKKSCDDEKKKKRRKEKTGKF